VISCCHPRTRTSLPIRSSAEAQNAELRETVDGLEQSLVQAKMELAMLKAQVDGF
jgi:hypothetical protein